MGYATGIVGLRLFNPDFATEKAAARWDPVRFYSDPSTTTTRSWCGPIASACLRLLPRRLTRAIRRRIRASKVGEPQLQPGRPVFLGDRMSCGMADKSASTGSSRTSRPGALDTSLHLDRLHQQPAHHERGATTSARLRLARLLGEEKPAANSTTASPTKYVPAGSPLAQFYQAPDKVDAARAQIAPTRSGRWGAQPVFRNIGLFSEEWLEHFRPFVGGQKFTPFPIATANRNSSYWNATRRRRPTWRCSSPRHRTAGPGWRRAARVSDPRQGQTERGKVVFAENCARCHSSKMPERTPTSSPITLRRPGLPQVLEQLLGVDQDAGVQTRDDHIVASKDFLDDNYLSNELRVPETLLRDQRLRLAGDQCDPRRHLGQLRDSYKSLPSVGSITVHQFFTGEPRSTMPAGGRGYIRPASLVSVWSTALPAQQHARRFLLVWLGGRPHEVLRQRHPAAAVAREAQGRPQVPDRLGKLVPGVIDVTSAQTFLRVPRAYRRASQPLVTPLASWVRPCSARTGWRSARSPAARRSTWSATWISTSAARRSMLLKIRGDLNALPGARPTSRHAALSQTLSIRCSTSAVPGLRGQSRPLFRTDYSTDEPGLSDADKWALIEFLKTM